MHMWLVSLKRLSQYYSVLPQLRLCFFCFHPKEYLEHVGALNLMLIFFGFSFITVPINSLFIAAGFAKYSFYIILLTNILYLLSAFYLGAIFGIYGVISAYAIQMIINKGLKIYFLNKHYSTWSTIIR